MNKEDNIKDNMIENVLELMEHPQEMADEELDNIINDSSSLQNYKDLMLCKQAVLKEYSYVRPNVEKEWKHFQQKRDSHIRKYILGACIGIAATIIVAFFCIQLNDWSKSKDGLVVFKSDNKDQQVILTTNSNEKICLDLSEKNKEHLQSLGVELENKDTLSLCYSHNHSKLETHKLVTPRGKDFKVTLADGTIVWLNADSQLEYPSRFEGEERVVRLSGEAYFKVAKDHKHPFIVKSDQIQTRVLGTELNIRNYSANDSHVTLIKGSVEVRNKEGRYTKLNPGEDAQLMNDGEFLLKNVDVDSYIYWKEGFFYFDDVPLVEIMQNIGRWYNVDIIFQNKPAMDYKMHFLCNRRAGLEHAILMLNRMKKVEAKMYNNKLYIQ